jgi:hypothetical protein
MAGSTYMGTDYANKTEKPRVVIHQPSLHFFGNTTPSGLWGRAGPRPRWGGLLGRCLLFESEKLEYPKDHAATVAAEQGVGGGHQGGARRRSRPQHFPGNLGEQAIGGRHPEALHGRVGQQGCGRVLQAAWHHRDGPHDFHEGLGGARSMAGCARTSRRSRSSRPWPETCRRAAPPAITWGDLQWASRVFERCMADMEHALVENVADNEYQSDRNKLAKIIRA